MSVIDYLVLTLRWIARVVGLMLFGLILAFLIGEGPPSLGATLAQTAQMLGLLTAWLGMLILWRWEGTGGAMVLGGLGTFYAVEWITSGRFPGGWVFPLMFLPGILALFCRWCGRRVACTGGS